MEGMEENGMATEPAHGLSGNLLREVLRTGPLKEIMLLQMQGIDPENASKLVETMLWEDPAVSLSLIGSAPGMINWLLEFLLELGRQLDGLPGPLLGDMLGKTVEEIDRERLNELREVYARLMRRLVLEDPTSGQARAVVTLGMNAALAGADRLTSRLDEDREAAALALARAADELDVEALGRVLNRLLALGNAARRARRVTAGERYRALLSQVDGWEAFTALGGMLESAAGAAWSLLKWSVRPLLLTNARNRK